MSVATADGADAAGPVLALPSAPAITRGVATRFHRNRIAGIALLVVGVVLSIGTLAGGIFGDVAAGRQMLDTFEPHLQVDAMAGYRSDVALLRAAGVGLDRIYTAEHLSPQDFPAVDDFRRQAPAISARADDLLSRITTSVADHRRLSTVGGLDRIPFLLFVVGLVAIVAGAVVLVGGRRAAVRALVATMVAGTTLALTPFLGGLASAAGAGDRLVGNLAPVMNPAQVRVLQNDFVVVVSAMGVLDTDFRAVAAPGPDREKVAALQQNWSTVSGDLARLVGDVNDNIDNYRALADLNDATAGVGVSGFRALPWLLVGAGIVTVATALVAWPRKRKNT
ncbi:hypothetical protein QSJ18_10275 [Gordonia sp. ABSL1-1]|uniref:hypothetical protein n=1 Tax=Gordonia sp. ABSL1-1 TaxID=3053923 RepID=UPI0025748E18|nr:hypothetical protein [Gordonia sp. ABSL1-1]MDL9937128.1 hypothetical protein [Gordonia sp. ABSL1-1]